MKFKIEEITYLRGKINHYTIFDTQGDIHLIFGSYYRKVEHGELYNSVLAFIEGKTEWDFARKRIKWNRDDDEKVERSKWSPMSNDFNKFVVDVQDLYIDGLKKDLNTIEIIK